MSHLQGLNQGVESIVMKKVLASGMLRHVGCVGVATLHPHTALVTSHPDVYPPTLPSFEFWLTP